jgi:hypothetical protein
MQPAATINARQRDSLTRDHTSDSCRCDPAMLVCAIVADRFPASRAPDGVFFASGGLTAVGAGQSDGIALDGILSGRVTLKGYVDVAAEFGWHSDICGHYNLRL